MLDFGDDDDDLGDYEIDYGNTRPAAKKPPSSAPSSSSFRGRLSSNPSTSYTPPPASSSPAPKPTGGVFGFLNHTSAVTTPKKDVFDFSTTRAPSAPPTSTIPSSSSPYKIPPKSNSALDKAERFLSSKTTTPNVKTFTSSSSNVGFTMSDDEDDLDDIDEIDSEDVPQSKTSFSSFSISSKSTNSKPTKPASSNFTMSSDDEDLDIAGHSESEDEIPSKPASSVLKSFNLKTVDDLLGGNKGRNITPTPQPTIISSKFGNIFDAKTLLAKNAAQPRPTSPLVSTPESSPPMSPSSPVRSRSPSPVQQKSFLSKFGNIKTIAEIGTVKELGVKQSRIPLPTTTYSSDDENYKSKTKKYSSDEDVNSQKSAIMSEVESEVEDEIEEELDEDQPSKLSAEDAYSDNFESSHSGSEDGTINKSVSDHKSNKSDTKSDKSYRSEKSIKSDKIYSGNESDRSNDESKFDIESASESSAKLERTKDKHSRSRTPSRSRSRTRSPSQRESSHRQRSTSRRRGRERRKHRRSRSRSSSRSRSRSRSESYGYRRRRNNNNNNYNNEHHHRRSCDCLPHAVLLAPSSKINEPSSILKHVVDPTKIEAMATHTPHLIVANDMYKRQIEMIRDLVRLGNSFGAQLVQTDIGPKFSYTTLENTKEFIKKNKPRTLTMEEALKQVKAESRF